MNDEFDFKVDAEQHMKRHWEKYNDFLDKFGNRVDCPLINGTCNGFRCAAWVESKVYDTMSYADQIPKDLKKSEYKIKPGYCKEFGKDLV
jgi:hypothetical protein